MASIDDENPKNEKSVHTFYFPRSNQSVTMTQEQIERIPYLHALVSHSADFKIKRNKENAFVMADHLSYDTCFPILSSTMQKKTSDLLTQLPRHADVFELLENYDFFSMEPIPVPCMKSVSEMSRTEKDTFFEEHREADASEQYEAVAQLLLALATGKYNLDDSKIAKVVLDSLIDILAHAELFGPRLRYHTLIIMKNCCWNLFTNEQQALLLAYKRSLRKLPDKKSDPIHLNIKFTKNLRNPLCWIRRRTRRSYETSCLMYLRFQFYTLTYDRPCDQPDLFLLGWHRYFSYHYPTLIILGHTKSKLHQRDECYSHDLFCPCGYLDIYAKKILKLTKYSCESLKWLNLIRDPCWIKGPVTNFKLCMLGCCTSLDRRNDQHERKLKYSDRKSHWIQPVTVDKFKNRPTDNRSKSRR